MPETVFLFPLGRKEIKEKGLRKKLNERRRT
jgi:hypothetical protein